MINFSDFNDLHVMWARIFFFSNCLEKQFEQFVRDQFEFSDSTASCF